MQKSRSLLAVVLVAASAALGVTLRAAQVDQQNWADPPESLFNGVALFTHGGVQQEFTPTLDRMDSVQLYMGNRTAISWVGGDIVVNIRQGVNGPVLVASRPTYAPYAYEGPVGYGFSDPVPLVPGQTYALEPLPVQSFWAGPFYSIDSTYPGRYFAGRKRKRPKAAGRCFSNAWQLAPN